jgi:hypothetical protein
LSRGELMEVTVRGTRTGTNVHDHGIEEMLHGFSDSRFMAIGIDRMFDSQKLSHMGRPKRRQH